MWTAFKGRPELSVGHPAQDRLRRVLRRTPRILVQGTDARFRRMPQRRPPARRDRFPFAGRTADRNAVRTAAEQHLARRALHAQQDHPPGCRNAGRDRLDRPEAIAARRTTHARNPFPVIGNGFFCLQRQKKPLGRCVFVKNFYICVAEVSPMMKRSATYGFRQLPEAMPMMSMMSMRSRSGRA